MNKERISKYNEEMNNKIDTINTSIDMIKDDIKYVYRLKNKILK